MRSWAWVAGIVLCMACGTSSQAPNGPPTAPTPSPAPSNPAFAVLVFSKTAGFRHDSIGAGIDAVRREGAARGFSVDASEDAGVFSDDNLAKYRVVVFMSTTGDVLDGPQQAAFERFIRRGGGFVGVHSATDTEYDWPFYGGLVGAYFSDHPDVQSATVQVQGQDPTTSFLPRTWTRRDEWYNFRNNPRGAVTVLATLDERTYSGGKMAADHPIIWAHDYEGGRGWYTAGGHTVESFAEAPFVEHLGKGILWAARAI